MPQFCLMIQGINFSSGCWLLWCGSPPVGGSSFLGLRGTFWLLCIDRIVPGSRLRRLPLLAALAWKTQNGCSGQQTGNPYVADTLIRAAYLHDQKSMLGCLPSDEHGTKRSPRGDHGFQILALAPEWQLL